MQRGRATAAPKQTNYELDAAGVRLLDLDAALTVGRRTCTDAGRELVNASQHAEARTLVCLHKPSLMTD
jgi:hypothetical protein